MENCLQRLKEFDEDISPLVEIKEKDVTILEEFVSHYRSMQKIVLSLPETYGRHMSLLKLEDSLNWLQRSIYETSKQK